jgi:hypothetical protein
MGGPTVGQRGYDGGSERERHGGELREREVSLSPCVCLLQPQRPFPCTKRVLPFSTRPQLPALSPPAIGAESALLLLQQQLLLLPLGASTWCSKCLSRSSYCPMKLCSCSRSLSLSAACESNRAPSPTIAFQPAPAAASRHLRPMRGRHLLPWRLLRAHQWALTAPPTNPSPPVASILQQPVHVMLVHFRHRCPKWTGFLKREQGQEMCVGDRCPWRVSRSETVRIPASFCLPLVLRSLIERPALRWVRNRPLGNS